MGQNDRSAYRQPRAQSVSLRRVQGLEETLDVSLLEPNPCVVHDDPHTGTSTDLVLMRADHQFPTSVGDVAHRLDSVGQQIQHDLLKLNPIPENRWQIVRQRRPQHDPMPRYLGLNQDEYVPNHLPEVERCSVDVGFL